MQVVHVVTLDQHLPVVGVVQACVHAQIKQRVVARPLAKALATQVLEAGRAFLQDAVLSAKRYVQLAELGRRDDERFNVFHKLLGRQPFAVVVKTVAGRLCPPVIGHVEEVARIATLQQNSGLLGEYLTARKPQRGGKLSHLALNLLGLNGFG